MARIIFLHGASSSGKSTLAHALQTQLDTPFWHVSIDHLRDSGMWPQARFHSGDFDWSQSRAAFFDGFHASLAAYAGAGNDLIVEHILDTPGWFETLHGLLSGHDVFFVALHCPLPELNRREAARGDRPIGSAQRDFHSIHAGRSYDLELDTADGVADNVKTLLAAWRRPHRSSDFASPIP